MVDEFVPYLAGFIDGEGSLSIYSKCVRVTISNNCEAIVREISERTGFGRIQARRDCEWHNFNYQWNGGSMFCREWLPRLIPHLRVKRELAELLLAYVEGIRPNVNGPISPVSAEEQIRRDEIIMRVRAINKSRGVLSWARDAEVSR